MDRQTLDRIIGIVSDKLDPLGYECIECEWVAHERALRVFVDQPGGSVDLDDCVRATKALEDEDSIDQIIEGPYNLEVSSPGVERPLRKSEHFKRYIGKTIQVKLSEKINNRKKDKGKLMAISPDGYITVETREGDEWSFSLDKVNQAHLVHDWNQS